MIAQSTNLQQQQVHSRENSEDPFELPASGDRTRVLPEMSYSHTYLANQLGPRAQLFIEGQQSICDSSAASATPSWGVQNDSRHDSSGVPRQLTSTAHTDVSAGSAS